LYLQPYLTASLPYRCYLW